MKTVMFINLDVHTGTEVNVDEQQNFTGKKNFTKFSSPSE